MQWKEPKNTARYYWTKHIQMKMRQYGISEARVKRILRAPLRTEGGIADETIAVMQPLSTRWDPVAKEKKWTQELWLMYQVRAGKENLDIKNANPELMNSLGSTTQFRLISVWRYPGVTKPGEGVPEEILADLAEVM